MRCLVVLGTLWLLLLEMSASLRASVRLSAARKATVSPETPIRKAVKRTRSPAVVTPPPSKKAQTASNILSSVLETVKSDSPFIDLAVGPAELRPSATLTTGQCFNWIAVDRQEDASAWGTHNATEWVGTMRLSSGDSLVLVIRETPETTMYRVLCAPDSAEDVRESLVRYFQLEHGLQELYTSWSSQCSRLKKIAACIPGVRIIDQDPWECLVSFICSSNNNIPRITKMVQSIRQTYGSPLVTIGGTTIYSFPSLERLKSKATEADLRHTCGMGYRANYLMKTMETLESLGGERYLHELKALDDPVLVQEKLLQFTGVGRKVADCVALFSLNQADAIPVDVHVWNIAQRDYDAGLANVQSLTPTIYRQVGDLFRDRFTEKAGWAHSLLFVAELPSFRPVLPKDIVEEMDRFRDEEQAKKQAARDRKKASQEAA